MKSSICCWTICITSWLTKSLDPPPEAPPRLPKSPPLPRLPKSPPVDGEGAGAGAGAGTCTFPRLPNRPPFPRLPNSCLSLSLANILACFSSLSATLSPRSRLLPPIIPARALPTRADTKKVRMRGIRDESPLDPEDTPWCPPPLLKALPMTTGELAIGSLHLHCKLPSGLLGPDVMGVDVTAGGSSNSIAFIESFPFLILWVTDTVFPRAGTSSSEVWVLPFLLGTQLTALFFMLTLSPL